MSDLIVTKYCNGILIEKVSILFKDDDAAMKAYNLNVEFAQLLSISTSIKMNVELKTIYETLTYNPTDGCRRFLNEV